ncbi:class I SAM-dependent methyltransferase [Pseudoroseicyclus tamaricis]|uniref:Class I SAM-dependent methyltransferase n=1 Tax=Pseudoroseicyclus tamaricis TaxID=2705421 RepID=A0A6B2JZ29_9RHOB|nr:class I SAM-dependent methyltransferase [Pseudoroseicyclus tamaricis]NDV01879.1 class I SAM-dependent methyltransferase [Pseudoroseicyclus tamaricis]
MSDLTAADPRAHWEEFYRTKRTGASGRPSGALLRFVADLPPGRALDLGSSHGDDVLWLAARGWQALGVEISQTAVDRARARAEEAGLTEAARFEQRDLAEGLPEGPFDLVTALYLQSPVALPRADILRAAAGVVRPGGHLLVVSHGAPPPWAAPEHRAHDFPTVASELADLGAPLAGWETRLAELVERPGRGPEGETATLLDTVIFLRRLP